MRRLEFSAGKWVSGGCPGYSLPGPKEQPLPDTVLEIEDEIASMLVAMWVIETQIAGHAIAEVPDAYRACATPLRRYGDWFPKYRDRVRSYHRPNIPTLHDAPITSFIEAAYQLCSQRIGWLTSLVDYPEGMTEEERSDLVWRANAVIADPDLIFAKWPFDQIDYESLEVGIQLECSSLTIGAAPAVPEYDEQSLPAAYREGGAKGGMPLIPSYLETAPDWKLVKSQLTNAKRAEVSFVRVRIGKKPMCAYDFNSLSGWDKQRKSRELDAEDDED